MVGMRLQLLLLLLCLNVVVVMVVAKVIVGGLEVVLLLLLMVELIATVYRWIATRVVLFTLLRRVGVTHLAVLVIRQVVGLLLVVVLVLGLMVMMLGIVLGVHSTISFITCLLLHNRCRRAALLFQRTAYAGAGTRRGLGLQRQVVRLNGTCWREWCENLMSGRTMYKFHSSIEFN